MALPVLRYGKDEGLDVKFSSKDFLYCTECKRPIEKVEHMLFVEGHSLRGFCADECIVAFYTPLMEELEDDLLKKRTLLQIDLEEELFPLSENSEFFEKTLYSPEKIFTDETDIGQKFYIHHHRFKRDSGEFTFILVCLYYEDEPSFVALRVLTSHMELAKLYETSGLKEDVPEKAQVANTPEGELSKTDNIQLSEEIIESVDLKKSEALAELIGLMSDEDFSLEEFQNYESYIGLTLQHPDEIYSKQDNEGDDLFTYIKSFKEHGETFFYVVICLKINLDTDEEHRDAFLPVLAFPSKVAELYRHYAQGEVVKTNLKN